MSNKGTFNKRRSQEIILRLSQHGPLSASVLNRMLRPKMPPKKLREALYRLRDRKLVDERHHVGSEAWQGGYWQVSRDFLNEPTSQQIFNYDRNYLLRMRKSRGCLSSHEMRQLWIFTLNNLLPDAELVRREQIEGHDEARRILRLNEKSNLSLPDYLIFFSGMNDERLCIAFDFEELTGLSESTFHRLKSYARYTDLNGVIYVADTGTIHHASELLQQAMKRDPRLRKAGCAKTFFTLSTASHSCSRPLNQLLDAHAKQVSITDWYQQISEAKQARQEAASAH